MENPTYLEETFQIIKYIFEEIRPIVYHFLPFIIAGTILLIVLGVVRTALRKRTLPQEFIDDIVCLKFEFSELEDKYSRLAAIYHCLHNVLTQRYKSRKHFALEMLFNESQIKFFVSISKAVYSALTQEELSSLGKTEVATKEREEFIKQMGERACSSFGLELSRDFVFPLAFDPKAKTELALAEEVGEWVFIQWNIRPISEKIRRNLVKYIGRLKRGVVSPMPKEGFFQGCVQVVLPFLTFLADFLTLIFHGSKKNLPKEPSTQVREGLEEKVNLLKAKSNDGSVVEVRGVISVKTPDNVYLVLDEIQAALSAEDPNNFLLVKDFEIKMPKNVRDELRYANMGIESLDVLSSNEIESVIRQLA